MTKHANTPPIPPHVAALLEILRVAMSAVVLFASIGFLLGVSAGHWLFALSCAGLLVGFLFLGSKLPPTHAPAPVTTTLAIRSRSKLLNFHAHLVAALTRPNAPEVAPILTALTEQRAAAKLQGDAELLAVLTALHEAATLAQNGGESEAVALLPALEARINALSD